MTKPIPNTTTYPSIGHMKGSKVGSAERHISDGQQKILEQGRPGYRVIVQEKLDGSCVGVLRVGDKLFPVNRKGHEVGSSPHFQHHIFGACVEQASRLFFKLLNPGERIVGEWLAQAHGIKYRLAHGQTPYYPFDIFTPDNQRVLYGEFITRLRDANAGLETMTPRLVYAGNTGYSLSLAKEQIPYLERTGPAIDPIEGFVYRAESKGKVMFLGKYVRPGHQTGQYLETVTGSGPVWNWPLAEAIWAQKLEQDSIQTGDETIAES